MSFVNIHAICSVVIGCAGWIRSCMLCVCFVLIDGVITMRVDFESKMWVSKPLASASILHNVWLVAQIITKSICCCFLIYSIVFQDVTLQSLLLLLRFSMLLSDVVIICLCSVMLP